MSSRKKMRGLKAFFLIALFFSAGMSASANELEKITVDAASGDSVSIETAEPTRYTAFRLSSPPRLFLDMPGVDVAKIKTPIAVDNSYISEIKVASYGMESHKNIGRVEIGLKEGVEYVVKSGDKAILVSLRKESSGEPASKEDAPEPAKEAGQVAQATGAKEAVPAGTALKSIEFTKDDKATVVLLKADGAIGNYNTFGLDNPSRLVLDIWDVDNATGKYLHSIGTGQVETIRIGRHPNRVRLVFDFTGDKTPSFTTEKKGDTLIVSFAEAPKATPKATGEEPRPVTKEVVAEVAGPKAEPAKAEPPKAKTEDKPTVNPTTASASLEAVDFRKTADGPLLVVRASEKPDYTVKKSLDGRLITLDINDVVVPEELTRTLDATDLGTDVVSISSYQSSNEPRKTARVLIKLKQESAYEVTEDANSINIAFALPAPAAKASAPTEPQASSLASATGGGAEGSAPVEYTGTLIDLDMVDAEISDILKLIAEVSNLNIIVADEVKGKVTMRLKRVPWDQAFDIILKTKNLDRIHEGNVVRVNLADKIRQEKESHLASLKAKEKVEPLGIKYIQINYEKAKDLEPHVAKVLSDRGSVTSHETTNTLIVKDIPARVTEAEDVVKSLDRPVPQVLIEARIVEAQSSFARDLGIQWGVDYMAEWRHTHTNVFGSSDQLGSAAYDPGVQDAITDGGGVQDQEKKDWPVKPGVTNYAVNLPAAGSAGTLGALGFILGTAGANPLILDLRLSAGEQSGLLKTISRPRITTLNNKEAKIEQGESIPFSTTSSSGTQTIFIDANLSLTVTPQITPDGSVLMKIKASRNSIGSFRTSSGEPSINKKEATTDVLVKDGETTVIGGIVISDTSESDMGIPYLKDIPGLGWLFKSKSVYDNQTELLIFITPSIIKDILAAG